MWLRPEPGHPDRAASGAVMAPVPARDSGRIHADHRRRERLRRVSAQLVWGACAPGMSTVMIARRKRARWPVRLSIARRGGWRAWGTASGNFERQLAAQASATVTESRIEAESSRGPDYVRVTLAMTITAADVAEALTTAWWAFRSAARDDAAGWDMASAAAEVQPDGPLAHRLWSASDRSASRFRAEGDRSATA